MGAFRVTLRPGGEEEATEREWEEMNPVLRGMDTRDGEKVLAVFGFLFGILHEIQPGSPESLQ